MDASPQMSGSYLANPREARTGERTDQKRLVACQSHVSEL